MLDRIDRNDRIEMVPFRPSVIVEHAFCQRDVAPTDRHVLRKCRIDAAKFMKRQHCCKKASGCTRSAADFEQAVEIGHSCKYVRYDSCIKFAARGVRNARMHRKIVILRVDCSHFSRGQRFAMADEPATTTTHLIQSIHRYAPITEDGSIQRRHWKSHQILAATGRAAILVRPAGIDSVSQNNVLRATGELHLIRVDLAGVGCQNNPHAPATRHFVSEKRPGAI